MPVTPGLVPHADTSMHAPDTASCLTATLERRQALPMLQQVVEPRMLTQDHPHKTPSTVTDTLQ
jgi:hypothetical protein